MRDYRGLAASTPCGEDLGESLGTSPQVGVIYAMGIKHSEDPIAACLVVGATQIQQDPWVTEHVRVGEAMTGHVICSVDYVS